MQRFAELYESLDTTTSTTAKVEAITAYFRAAPPEDAAWAAFVLIGRRPKRCVGPALLRQWLAEEAQLPVWLVEESYASVGDLAETIALLVAQDAATTESVSLSTWFNDRLLPLRGVDPAQQRAVVVSWWKTLPYRECFLVNKLLTGALRVGVSRSLVTRALATLLGRPRPEIERSLIGEWSPSAFFWEQLLSGAASTDLTHPYPFYLASPLTGAVQELGAREAWLAEWKWDGIRGQLVRRGSQCALWSRGEEVITDRFPEIVSAARALPPGTVLDGEVLAWQAEGPLPFAQLQRRIQRKTLSAKLLQEVPVRFLCYDLLEYGGVDWRARPLRERRAKLQELVPGEAVAGAGVLGVSPLLAATSWHELTGERARARTLNVEGIMLKHRESAYGTGRQRGAWWKWKIDPLVFDGVLIYAAAGHGRRSNLYTDYTFAVWRGEELVPVAKAYSGLDDVEIRQLDKWIRAHTREKFGPVRSVEPVHVFELAYEGIAASMRHKSGLAVRFPRIVRWRHDKPAGEADTLENLQQVLAGHGRHGAPG